MKAGVISRFVVVAALAAVVVVGGNTKAWAVCPTSPNYTPDFTNDEGCLTLNGNFVSDDGSSGGNPQFVPSGNLTVLRLTKADVFQAGSAWFTGLQPVAGGFSTTFTFQLSGANTFLCGQQTPCPADGIAFLIQTAGTGALGPDGCGIGFGGNSSCQGPGPGITNSLAVEFDTFDNGMPDNNSANHVAIQSCPSEGPNSTDLTNGCTVANVNLSGSVADGNVHTVTISYASGKLSVILDNKDLFKSTFPGGVPFDLTTLGLNGTNLDSAYVGFTAATGGADDNQDILNWTFTPEAQSAAITNTTGATLNFNGGVGGNNTGYDYTAKLTAGPEGTEALTSATVTVNRTPIDEEACEQLVQKNPQFGHAQCFVFQNGNGQGNPSAVLFSLTCPGLTDDSCDQSNFFADLGADFVFQKSDNPGFKLLNSTIGPYAGWLKGHSGLPDPCDMDNEHPLMFQSNQIESFSVSGDPTGTLKGGARPGGSCWVATYATGGELPPVVKITSPTVKTYTKSSTPGTAMYTCSDPKTSKDPATSSVGPYLTAASCQQHQAPNLNNSACSNPNNVNGVITCTGTFDLSVKGLHVFTVTSKDTGGNVGANAVVYNVK